MLTLHLHHFRMKNSFFYLYVKNKKPQRSQSCEKSEKSNCGYILYIQSKIGNHRTNGRWHVHQFFKLCLYEVLLPKDFIFFLTRSHRRSVLTSCRALRARIRERKTLVGARLQKPVC